MPTDPSVDLKKTKEGKNILTEVSYVEKLLWAHIQSKGVLGADVKDLYCRACCIYEKLFLSEIELPDLHTIEYLLWRLHYKHIDEFRKRISQNLAKEEDKFSTNQNRVKSKRNTVDKYMEGFKLFLSEATKFYQDMIRKIKRYYGLVDEPWFYKNGRISSLAEQTKLHKCQFVCHRLCICVGDLARYLELYEKMDDQKSNWSVAANCYFEAAKIYPDGGNPQNQLAVLATYIGDEFLALYHCIRSLAVKEPFPDALQNLMLLFERNRSCNIGSLSNEVYDVCKPSQWISSLNETTANVAYSNKTALKPAEHDQSLSTDLWPLIIRMASFFFLESSLDNFFCTFTSTLRELEVMLALDVVKLSPALECYKNLNLSKAGPYRALHLIFVLLFIIHNLNEEPGRKILKPTNETHQFILLKLALTVTFICMGRLVDRCLKGSPVVYFPLLPALLVFAEWLVGTIDKVDLDDEKCESSVRYFFGSFVQLLNLLQENTSEDTFPDRIALWEDYEFRGFAPLSHTHESLDFSSHWEEEINYKMKNEYRAHRIVQAALKIAKKSSDKSQKWVFYAEAGRKFRTREQNETVANKDLRDQECCSDLQAKGPHPQIHGELSSEVEEEEDIVFRPIVRHNSEPIQMDGQQKASTSEDCLRRASSLLMAQSRDLIDSLTTHTAIPSASSGKHKQDEPGLKSSLPSTCSEGHIAAGPPSLSSWVLNGEKLTSGRAKGNEVHRSILKPIEENISEDMGGLPISRDESSSVSSSVTYPSTYLTPIPSAPLLPENGVWFTDSSLGVHQMGAGVPSLIDYSPYLAPMCDYPWSVPQFPKLSNHNLQSSHNNAMLVQSYTPRNMIGVHHSDASRFNLLDGWSYNHPFASSPTMWFEASQPPVQPSSSLLHGLYNQRTDNFQRASPYVSHTVMDARSEPQPLLQYLKQKEWQLQQGSEFTGTYTQN